MWRDSGTYNIVLSTLGIDSRIVVSNLSWRNNTEYWHGEQLAIDERERTPPPQLDGPGWLGQVRQAATLLTPGLLTPVPAARQEKVKPSCHIHTLFSVPCLCPKTICPF